MKTALLVLAIPALLCSGVSVRADITSPTVTSSCCDPPARWAPRHDVRDARLAILSEDGDAALVLTEEVVALQLSDRAFHRVNRKLRDEQKKDDEEDNPLADALKTVILSGVRALLDHSAECPIRELASVDYEKGRLVFTGRDGKQVFEKMEVNDDEVMGSFSEQDALRFVREFKRVKARSR